MLRMRRPCLLPQLPRHASPNHTQFPSPLLFLPNYLLLLFSFPTSLYFPISPTFISSSLSSPFITIPYPSSPSISLSLSLTTISGPLVLKRARLLLIYPLHPSFYLLSLDSCCIRAATERRASYPYFVPLLYHHDAASRLVLPAASATQGILPTILLPRVENSRFSKVRLS